MTLLDVAVASFGCPTLMPLRPLCSHDYTFGSPCNCRFGYGVSCLEDCHFNFLESRPLTQWGLAVGSPWVVTLEFGLLDGVLMSCFHIQFDVPHVLQRLTESGYLYPLVASFHLCSTLNFSVFSLVCHFLDFPRKFTQSFLFFTTPLRLLRKKKSSLVF